MTSYIQTVGSKLAVPNTGVSGQTIEAPSHFNAIPAKYPSKTTTPGPGEGVHPETHNLRETSLVGFGLDCAFRARRLLGTFAPTS